jgi:HAD superfamily hydrolase (TIGR01490 family)
MYSYAAFFDLDRTILSVNSGSELVREAYKAKLMSSRDLWNAIGQAFMYKFRLKNTSKIIEKMGSWLEGLPEEAFIQLAARVAGEFLIPAIRPAMKAEMEMHRNLNATLVILSTAMEPVCAHLVRYLEMDGALSSRLEVVDGLFTGRPSGKFCYGDEKRARLNEYCSHLNLRPADAWFYSDSISDKEALGAVGHPVCISPDKQLRRMARRLGWEIRDL